MGLLTSFCPGAALVTPKNQTIPLFPSLDRLISVVSSFWIRHTRRSTTNSTTRIVSNRPPDLVGYPILSYISFSDLNLSFFRQRSIIAESKTHSLYIPAARLALFPFPSLPLATSPHSYCRPHPFLAYHVVWRDTPTGLYHLLDYLCIAL